MSLKNSFLKNDTYRLMYFSLIYFSILPQSPKKQMLYMLIPIFSSEKNEFLFGDINYEDNVNMCLIFLKDISHN